jgi:hypothetical protein
MMLAELTLLLQHVEPTATPEQYLTAIVQHNALGKATQTTRQRTAERLVELYTLDLACPLFRLLRHFWDRDPAARPLLALLAAAARDLLLRELTPYVLSLPINGEVVASQVADQVRERHPARFRPTTLLSTAQNLSSSWTQAGFLAGRIRKRRTRSTVTPVVVTFALLLGYLCGQRGELLLDSTWTRLLDRTSDEVVELAVEASRQGWLVWKGAGSVIEVTFPGLLTPREELASHESNRPAP